MLKQKGLLMEDSAHLQKAPLLEIDKGKEVEPSAGQSGTSSWEDSSLPDDLNPAAESLIEHSALSSDLVCLFRVP